MAIGRTLRKGVSWTLNPKIASGVHVSKVYSLYVPHSREYFHAARIQLGCFPRQAFVRHWSRLMASPSAVNVGALTHVAFQEFP